MSCLESRYKQFVERLNNKLGKDKEAWTQWIKNYADDTTTLLQSDGATRVIQKRVTVLVGLLRSFKESFPEVTDVRESLGFFPDNLLGPEIEAAINR